MLEKSALIAFGVWAIYSCYQEGMIFGRVQTWFANLVDFIKKPLMDCSICMTPWYGSIIYWVLLGDSRKEWVVSIMAATGINSFLVYLKSSD